MRGSVKHHLAQLDRYYKHAIPKNLKAFCNAFLDALDYNRFCVEFARKWKTGTDGRHALFVALINKLLTTKMVWPPCRDEYDQEPPPPMRVGELPQLDKEMVIDYTGYLIGLPQGQGNDCLLGIYKRYY